MIWLARCLPCIPMSRFYRSHFTGGPHSPSNPVDQPSRRAGNADVSSYGIKLMPADMHLQRVSDLTADELAAVRRLSAAVYPPEMMASWPGRSIEWASVEWCVVCWDDEREKDERKRAFSHVGLLLRDSRVNGQPARIGGIGGVMTDPADRGRGLASAALTRAAEFLLAREADFGLLVCEPELVRFYERLGWRLYEDDLVVIQSGERIRFTFNLPMVRPLRTAEPAAGTIDILGPPW